MALASDGVLSKQELSPDGHCHMKFPAMHQRSLARDQPVLKDEPTGDVIDFLCAVRRVSCRTGSSPIPET
jgi:hypothetical protein